RREEVFSFRPCTDLACAECLGLGFRHRQQPVALGLLAGRLAGTPDGLAYLARALVRGLFIGLAALHLAKQSFALKLLLQDLHGLVDVVVANKYLQDVPPFRLTSGWNDSAGPAVHRFPAGWVSGVLEIAGGRLARALVGLDFEAEL